MASMAHDVNVDRERQAYIMGFQKAMSYYPRDPSTWKRLDDGSIACASCGTPIKARFTNDYLFCPFCGARMFVLKSETVHQ